MIELVGWSKLDGFRGGLEVGGYRSVSPFESVTTLAVWVGLTVPGICVKVIDMKGIENRI